jgi:hypothetical protein
MSFDGVRFGSVTFPAVRLRNGRGEGTIASRLEVTSLPAFAAFSGALLGGRGCVSVTASGSATFAVGTGSGSGFPLPTVLFQKSITMPDCGVLLQARIAGLR